MWGQQKRTTLPLSHFGGGGAPSKPVVEAATAQFAREPERALLDTTVTKLIFVCACVPPNNDVYLSLVQSVLSTGKGKTNR